MHESGVHYVTSIIITSFSRTRLKLHNVCSNYIIAGSSECLLFLKMAWLQKSAHACERGQSKKWQTNQQHPGQLFGNPRK
jgi:hypothetical protein